MRAHWEIENKVRGVPDIVSQEDACRVRKGNAPSSLATTRRVALNLPRGEQSAKCSIGAKRRKAAWGKGYVFKARMGLIRLLWHSPNPA